MYFRINIWLRDKSVEHVYLSEPWTDLPNERIIPRKLLKGCRVGIVSYKMLAGEYELSVGTAILIRMAAEAASSFVANQAALLL